MVYATNQIWCISHDNVQTLASLFYHQILRAIALQKNQMIMPLRTIGYDMEACNYLNQHHCLSKHAMVTNILDVLDASWH
jgi:hypothetical protein